MIHIPEEHYSYEYDVEKLYPGCSLGNLECYTYIDRFSNISGVWCSDNTHYMSKMEVSLSCDGLPFEPSSTFFAPAYQYTKYHGAGLSARKIAFIPYGCGYLRSAYQVITIENSGPSAKDVEIFARVRFSGINANECCKSPDFDDLEQRIDIRNEGNLFIAQNSPLPYSKGISGNPGRCRILGSPSTPESYLIARPSRCDIRYKIRVESGSTVEIPIIFVATDKSEKAARDAFDIAKDYESIFRQTIKNLRFVEETSNVITPDELVNRGIFWSKMNTVRVQHRYPLGHGFTNMPPYDILVVRDASWYTCGNNYLTPDFSRKLIKVLADNCRYESGQMTEFIKLTQESAVRDVYGISINDCTPMYVIALYKHYCMTCDEDFLREYYPIAEKAAEYIISNMKDGLVFATTPGTSMYGVVGWRNVLAGSHINGFVPELNAICAQSLKLAALLAEKTGNLDKQVFFNQSASTIKDEMNGRLVSQKTGLYHLMIDQWGQACDEISADMAVPLLYDIPPDDLRQRTLDMLLSPQFWTPFGCRTVGSEQPEYDPDYLQAGADMTLMGGIWPNTAGWVAYASRKSDPARVAEALGNIYRISEVPNLRDYGHVCPGEFPECLHGETFTSMGMKCSPWTPPSYLWLAMEGLVGIEPNIDRLVIDPHLPPVWNWFAVKNIPSGWGSISFFMWNGMIFSNRSFETSYSLKVYPDEIECSINSSIYSIALRNSDDISVFLYAHKDVEYDLELNVPGHGYQSIKGLMKKGNTALVHTSVTQN